jgi:hypothetical protein
MSANVRFRDVLRTQVPWWLSDRHFASGATVGFRFLWSMIAPLDAFMEFLYEGLQASWPGVGTSTALPQIGRSRGLLRSPSDTDQSFVDRLLIWLDKWAHAGSQKQLAIELHEYIRGNPRIRIVNRAQHWITVDTNGAITTHDGDWDWDSVSHPERAGFWSEMWIIVYPAPTAWGTTGPFLDTAGAPVWGDDGFGIGHDVPRDEFDAVRSVLANWKSAHTKIRAVIWTSDGTLFDPVTPFGLPDGQWGGWGGVGNGTRVASNRNYTTCKYWEPNP